MPCAGPLKGWYSKHTNETGRRSVVFSAESADFSNPIEVPCGQCILCKIDKARQWAVRIQDEARLYDNNVFLTLTYDDEHLPKNATLDKRDFQLFIKRLRKHLEPHKIRFFHCGEYGSNDSSKRHHLQQYGISPLGRPHYHAILFNIDFPDKQYLKEKDGFAYYYSPLIESIWRKGFNVIGQVSFDSANYVAGYITKKRKGDNFKDYYKRVNIETGEIVDIEPEYSTMSRRPGIGSEHYEKYKGDMYPKDFTTVNGQEVSIPRYYDRKLELDDDYLYEMIKEKRREHAYLNKNKDRLRDKEKITKAKIKLKRNGEL